MQIAAPSDVGSLMIELEVNPRSDTDFSFTTDINEAVTLQTTVGSFGGGNGGLNRPVGVAADRNDNIFVADNENHLIQVFDYVGNSKRQRGGKGSAAGKFDIPTDVALDSAGNVYVVDKLWGRDLVL